GDADQHGHAGGGAEQHARAASGGAEHSRTKCRKGQRKATDAHDGIDDSARPEVRNAGELDVGDGAEWDAGGQDDEQAEERRAGLEAAPERGKRQDAKQWVPQGLAPCKKLIVSTYIHHSAGGVPASSRV